MDKIYIVIYLFLGYFAGRSKHIIGIFNQHGLCVAIAAFLGTSHGMAADEIWLDSKCFHLPVDICLNASYIGKNAAIVQISFDLL